MSAADRDVAADSPGIDLFFAGTGGAALRSPSSTDQPTTGPSVRGWIVVDKKTGALDWDGELHPTHEAAYLGLRAYGDTVEATEERRTFYDVLPVLAPLPAPRPSADTERDERLRALGRAATKNAEAMERLYEIGQGVGGLGVQHPEMFEEHLAWIQMSDNDHADTVLELLAEVDRLAALSTALDLKEADRG